LEAGRKRVRQRLVHLATLDGNTRASLDDPFFECSRAIETITSSRLGPCDGHKSTEGHAIPIQSHVITRAIARF